MSGWSLLRRGRKEGEGRSLRRLCIELSVSRSKQQQQQQLYFLWYRLLVLGWTSGRSVLVRQLGLNIVGHRTGQRLDTHELGTWPTDAKTLSLSLSLSLSRTHTHTHAHTYSI